VCVCVLSEVSTRLVSEYKTKLQISDAENSRLDGMVSTGSRQLLVLLQAVGGEGRRGVACTGQPHFTELVDRRSALHVETSLRVF